MEKVTYCMKRKLHSGENDDHLNLTMLHIYIRQEGFMQETPQEPLYTWAKSQLVK